MKRYLTVVCVLGIVWALSGAAASATSNNTISIDGNNSGWASDETFSVSPGSGYFTWDADYIYFGIAHAEADYGNLATFMYIDTDPQVTPTTGNGTTGGFIWQDSVTLPFRADYTIVWKNQISSDYIEVRQWNGSSWNQVASATSTELNSGSYYVQFAIGTDYREVRIKRSTFGSPEHIHMASLTMQNYGSWYKYFFWPSDAASPGTGNKTLTTYFGFPLIAGVSPNHPCNANTYPAGTKSGGSYGTASIWTGGAVPDASNAHVQVANGHTVTLDSARTARCLTILSGGTFNGSSYTLTLEGSNTASPILTNAGAFTAGAGTVHFKGQAAMDGTPYNGRVWGPNATTFNNVTLTYNGSGTGSEDTFGVDFYDQDSPAVRATINGVLALNTRTFVAHAEVGRSGGGCSSRDCGTPTYGSSSTLRYNDLEYYTEFEPNPCPTPPSPTPGDADTYQVFGEWLNATSGHGVPHHVTVGSDSWVSLFCNPGANYRVNGDFTVEAGVDGNTYGGSGSTPPGFEQNGFTLGKVGSSTVTVMGDVVNNGTLKQIGPAAYIAPGSTVSFIRIQDDASTTKYYGLDIKNTHTTNNLDVPFVKVSGNQTTCPYWGDPPGYPYGIVKRCYSIEALSTGTDPVSYEITLYYEHSELNGFDPNTLYVWEETNYGNWKMYTPTFRSTCTSGQIDCYVKANIVGSTLLAMSGRSPLGGAPGESLFVLSGNSPLAVDLAAFTAEVAPDGVALAWETVSEQNNIGFRVLRSETADGERVLLAFVPAAAPGSTAGASYRYVDTTAAPGRTYWYWLEDVDTAGGHTLHGPVSARAAPAGRSRRLWLPLIGR